jgi:hypothetical protein
MARPVEKALFVFFIEECATTRWWVICKKVPISYKLLLLQRLIVIFLCYLPYVDSRYWYMQPLQDWAVHGSTVCQLSKVPVVLELKKQSNRFREWTMF